MRLLAPAMHRHTRINLTARRDKPVAPFDPKERSVQLPVVKHFGLCFLLALVMSSS